MTDELLDLVNESDEIVGEVMKSKANANPKLLHREVAVYLYDKKGRALLHQRSFTKKVQPGMWSIVAGHVSKDEEVVVAAHRELQEEMGFDTDLNLIRKEKVVRTNEVHFTSIFIGEYHGEELILPKAEVEAAKLFSKDEYLALVAKGMQVDNLVDKFCREFWDGKIKV